MRNQSTVRPRIITHPGKRKSRTQTRANKKVVIHQISKFAESGAEEADRKIINFVDGEIKLITERLPHHMLSLDVST